MAKYQNKRIGILGGSFDPAHKGHLIISKIALKQARLEKIYWIVTKKNPFKKKTFFSLKERLVRSKKIVKNFKNIQVLYIDNIINSSRSIDIIKFIKRKKNVKDLYFIVGSDILLKFHKWKSWKRIIKLVKIIVFNRKGYDRKSKESIVVKYINKDKIIFIKNKPIQISSSNLRKKIFKKDKWK